MTTLSDVFPLRRAAVWGGFASNDEIPLRYGYVRGACVEYVTGNRDEPRRRRFVWSDGACAGVDAVFVDGQRRPSGWIARNEVDVTGQPVMMVTFLAAVPADALVEAQGRGRVAAGAMIRNPARVLADLLAIAGIDAPPLDVFEVECGRLGLQVSGSVQAGEKVRVVLQQVCASAGARYSLRMRDTAMVYPGGSPELVGRNPLVRAQLDQRHLTGARADLADMVNAMTVEFDLRDGSPAQVMEIEAPESIAAYGRRSSKRSAEFLGTAGVVEAVHSRLLQHAARPAYTVQFEGFRGDLRPGDWVAVDAERSLVPFAGGVHRLVATAYDHTTRTSSGEFEIWPGDPPATRIVRTATILETQQTATAAVQNTETARQITLAGPDGIGLGGAKVVLDGVVTRFADAAGVVTFPIADTPAGAHQLTVTTSATGNTQPINLPSGDGTVTVPSQAVSLPVTFVITVVFT
jgi:hypothetical protein